MQYLKIIPFIYLTFFILVLSSCKIKEFDNIPDPLTIETCENEHFLRLIEIDSYGPYKELFSPWDDDYLFIYVTNDKYYRYDISLNILSPINNYPEKFSKSETFFNYVYPGRLKEFDLNGNFIKEINPDIEFNSFIVGSDNSIYCTKYIDYCDTVLITKILPDHETIGWSRYYTRMVDFFPTTDSSFIQYKKKYITSKIDVQLRKISSEGELIWEKIIFSNVSSYESYKFINLSNGDILVLNKTNSGNVIKKIDAAGNPGFTKTINYNSELKIFPANDGGFIYFTSELIEGKHFFAMNKCNNSGEIEWTKVYPAADGVKIMDIKALSTGEFLLSGLCYIYDGENVYHQIRYIVIKADSSGNICN
ncbi:MAG: hypothetical protein A2W91_10090 [Bacteroidetes bacterium GWF2_38_335]|nr:MAG: hypothetical protein A2W91_10090 [Bacteroidetes bacterium GWF2_38_335]HBS88025.1 hypothetical protein [Bacteroidales bacterium]